MNIIFILSALIFVFLALYCTKQLLSLGKRLKDINISIAIYFVAATLSIGAVAYALVKDLIDHFSHAQIITIKNENITLLGAGVGLALLIVIASQLLSLFVYNTMFDNTKEDTIKEFASNNIYMALIKGGMVIGFTLAMLPLIEIIFNLLIPNKPILRGGGYN